MHLSAVAVSKSFQSSGKFLADCMTLQTMHFYAFGPFRFDSEKRVLVRDGTPVPLAPKATEILLVLVENAGHLVEKETLINRVWRDAFVEEGNLNKNIFFLRKALGECEGGHEYIETVPKRGYRFISPVRGVTHAEGASQPPSAGATNLTGKKVSHYRVMEVLGGGGMGVVYTAEDLKLGRRVALKFLPEELGSDPKSVARFEREARAASALDHPNICAIHEFGEHDGRPFLVMPLLVGETLRDRIADGNPLPTDTLLDVSIQIADGLDAAHRKGIIHRDIKPTNIFLTERGEAKILDFGLAKLAPSVCAAAVSSRQNEPGGDSDYSGAHEQKASAVPNPSLTLTGAAMGTAGYMSPEQVRGEMLDASTDLFSFGLVLYEMATGKRAFAGDTERELHESILTQAPCPAPELNPDLPPKLGKIISGALAKDRGARYASAAEMRTDLENLKREIEPKHHTRLWEVAAAAAIVLIIASAAFLFTKHQSASRNIPRELKMRQLTTNSSENGVKSGAISPDGKYLAYTDRLGIHIKLIESGEMRTIPQPEDSTTLADWEIGPWFPDSTRFLANTHPPGGDGSNWTSKGSTLWMVSMLGGPPRKIRDEAYADAISRDGSTITFDTNAGRFGDREIWLMDVTGERAHKLFEADENSAIGGLNWSPDEQLVVYEQVDENGPRLVSRDLKGGSVVSVLSPSEAKRLNDYRWLPDGRLIFALWETVPEEGTCNYWQTRLDLQTGKSVEKPTRVTNWVGSCVGGTIATADSKRLAFGQWIGHTSVYVADFQPGGSSISAPNRLTLDVGYNEPLRWTADSKTLLFSSTRNGPAAIFKQSLGRDAEILVTPESDQHFAGNVGLSPNGSSVFYMVAQRNGNAKTGIKIMEVPITGGTPHLIWTANVYEKGVHCARSPATLCAIAQQSKDHTAVTFSAFEPARGLGRELAESKADVIDAEQWDLSPDGIRIVALEGKEGGIQIIPLDGDPSREFTVKGWTELRNVNWTADGKGLIVSTLNEKGSVLLSVDLKGNAHTLWEQTGGAGTYAVPSPDGRHLAMLGWTVDNNIWMMENF